MLRPTMGGLGCSERSYHKRVTDSFKTALREEIEREAWPLIEEGALRPVMDEIFALEDADKAHARMENGDHIGKIVLAVDESL